MLLGRLSVLASTKQNIVQGHYGYQSAIFRANRQKKIRLRGMKQIEIFLTISVIEQS